MAVSFLQTTQVLVFVAELSSPAQRRRKAQYSSKVENRLFQGYFGLAKNVPLFCLGFLKWQ